MGRIYFFFRRLSFVVVLLLVLIVASQVRGVLRVPGRVLLLPGQEWGVDVGRWLTIVDVSAGELLLEANEAGGLLVRGEQLGSARLQLRLFGLLPLRSVQVNVVPELAVVPGGQAIGVLVSSHGLVVTQTSQVVGIDGSARYPARDAGLLAGDIIVEMAGTNVYGVDQVQEIVERYGRRGESVPVTIVRNGARLRRTLPVVPIQVRTGGVTEIQYRIGLRLENPAAGVGTLTFYEPVEMRFGGLGHMITDGLNNRVEVTDGRIVEAMIRGIQQGARGFPGEKIGVFDGQHGEIGVIEKNTRYGIYGVLHEPPRHHYTDELLPVALAHEVTPGDAMMLTVVNGQTVEPFALRILQVHPQRRSDGRGLVIEITDRRLLEATRGIVQGMSGSPIIQDGKLVGAVTHVFVNDPTRGYGILAEWMAYEAEILPANSEIRQESHLMR